MQNSDNFLAWIRSHSVNGYENAAQIVDVPNSKYKIGFYIYSEIANNQRRLTSFTVHGLVYSEFGFSYRGYEYYADFCFYSETKTAYLGDNTLDPYYRNRGIGSLGLDYIKSFLRALGCTTLTGTKHPIPNTPDEMAKLTAFYEKNGFQQLADNKIIFHFR